MWELGYKEGWMLKNWCFWTVVLEKTLENPWDWREIKPVNPKENQSWIFIGRTDAEAEALILWPPNAKSQLIGKDPDAGKDRRQEEKGMTENVTVGWHHGFNGCDFEPIPGDGEGQRNLAFCRPWGCKESDMTEWLNNNSKGEIILNCLGRPYLIRMLKSRNPSLAGVKDLEEQKRQERFETWEELIFLALKIKETQS